MAKNVRIFIVCILLITVGWVGALAGEYMDDVYYWPGQKVETVVVRTTQLETNNDYYAEETDEQEAVTEPEDAVKVEYLSVQDTVVKVVIHK